ncbi:hypothetical protein [Hwangdonia lutea]|uniref:Uncharacterized protein n=1 Tax=Hwangdonia lutea TaxID=3075823 RepID=A0AA97HSX2_9FLAO|nr:hypothetical protein [Hwangdonia sp. SCSIO 19198]WOD44928.1 hypothetical protein RNZ46_06570 [Hwangdonia sp. SCSIO 19198]
MDTLKMVLGYFLAFALLAIFISLIDGVDLGVFGIIIIFLIFIVAFVLVFVGPDIFKEEVKKHKVKKELGREELWNKKPNNKENGNSNSNKSKEKSVNKFEQIIFSGKSLESKNTAIWHDLIEKMNPEDTMSDIIKSFFIKDNIDFFKYGINENANTFCYTYGFNTNENLECTPSFLKYFTKDIMERALGIPLWFTLAYPDVEVWFRENKNVYGQEIEENPSIYIADGAFNSKAFRYIINTYKRVTKKKLECCI